MAEEVTKRDGTKQAFDSEKIKNAIRAAVDETDLADERKDEVVEKVSVVVISMADGKEEIATSEIREKVLSELDQLEPSVSEAWKKYDQENKAA